MRDAPTTVADLIAWFEENFLCFMGPARAFFEIETGPKTIFRGIYETYVVKSRASENQERLLVRRVFDDFAPLREAIGNEFSSLFWRLPEKITLKSESVQLFGPVLVTEELAKDNAAVPEGAVLNDATGDWHEDGGRVTEWSLRTRLCVPAMNWTNHPPMLTRHYEGQSYRGLPTAAKTPLESSRLLEAAGFVWSIPRECYVHPQDRKAVTVEFIDARPNVEPAILAPVTDSWQFWSVRPLHECAKQAIATNWRLPEKP